MLLRLCINGIFPSALFPWSPHLRSRQAAPYLSSSFIFIAITVPSIGQGVIFNILTTGMALAPIAYTDIHRKQQDVWVPART